MAEGGGRFFCTRRESNKPPWKEGKSRNPFILVDTEKKGGGWNRRLWREKKGRATLHWDNGERQEEVREIGANVYPASMRSKKKGRVSTVGEARKRKEKGTSPEGKVTGSRLHSDRFG